MGSFHHRFLAEHRFYQRLGFRMARIERDVFTPEASCPAELLVDGVRLLDRVWLARSLA